MKLSKRTVVILGISSIGIILIVAAWLAWPSSSEDDIKENLDITGDNNKVKTIQTKDFSLVHIEGLRAETGAHNTNRDVRPRDRKKKLKKLRRHW